jgi:hypothetical protein
MDAAINTTTEKKPFKKGGLFWSVVVYGATLALAGAVLVEMINIFFYDPYADDYFLICLTVSGAGDMCAFPGHYHLFSTADLWLAGSAA